MIGTRLNAQDVLTVIGGLVTLIAAVTAAVVAVINAIHGSRQNDKLQDTADATHKVVNGRWQQMADQLAALKEQIAALERERTDGKKGPP